MITVEKLFSPLFCRCLFLALILPDSQTKFLISTSLLIKCLSNKCCNFTVSFHSHYITNRNNNFIRRILRLFVINILRDAVDVADELTFFDKIKLLFVIIELNMYNFWRNFIIHQNLQVHLMIL